MRPTYWIAGLALASVSLLTPAANAQIVMSNEHLVSTTLVVNKKSVLASCYGSYCKSKPVQMFKPIHVTCPAAMGNTCTLNIALDAKTELSPHAEGTYQFLLDGAAPVPGPTDGQGFYLFSIYAPPNNQDNLVERHTNSSICTCYGSQSRMVNVVSRSSE
jgi:hypothetical protein